MAEINASNSALIKLTKQREAEAYLKMILRAWEFSSHVNHKSLEATEEYLIACNALLTYKEEYLKIIPDDTQIYSGQE